MCLLTLCNRAQHVLTHEFLVPHSDPFNQMMSAQTNPTAESLQPKGGEDDSEEEEDIEQMPVIVSMASELGDDDAVTFLVTARTTFGDLANDACKLWDRNVLNYSLWDDELNVWPISMKVMATLKEVRLVHANQAMRLAIKFEALEGKHALVTQSHRDELILACAHSSRGGQSRSELFSEQNLNIRCYGNGYGRKRSGQG